MSFTRSVTHSPPLNPAPYISSAIKRGTPVICPRIVFASSRLNTQGTPMASLDSFEPRKLTWRLLRHRFIEKYEGIQCLRLGRCRNPALGRQVIRKSLDFNPA